MLLIITRGALVLLGTAAVLIGLMIFLTGPDFTAGLFGATLQRILEMRAYAGGLEHVNIDSEMRFYAVFWIAYGCWVLRLQSNMRKNSPAIYGALGIFLLGGIGRLISWSVNGPPDILFRVLMYVEIIGPIAVASVYSIGIRRP